MKARMEFSDYQIRQLTNLLTSFVGIAGIALFFILLLASGAMRATRWWTLAGLLYVSTLGAFAFTGHNLFTPLQELRDFGRSVCVGLLIVLAVPTLRSSREWRMRSALAGTVVFFFYEMICSVRAVFGGDFEHGYFGAITYCLIFFTLAIGLGRWLQTIEDALAALRCIVAAGIMVIVGSAIQYAINPAEVIWSGRLIGTTANANFLGTLLAVCLLPTLYFATRTGATNRTRIGSMTLAAVTAVMMIWTGSRTGVAMGIAGVAMQFRRRMGRFVLVSAIGGAMSLLVWQAASPDSSTTDRFVNITNTRTSVWGVMWNEFVDNPLIGASREQATQSENSYLMVASRTGMLGLLPLLWSMALIVSSLLELRRYRRVLGQHRELLDLLLAAFISLAVGALFEGYLFGIFSIPVLSVYIYLALLAFLLDYAKAAVAESALAVETDRTVEEMYGDPSSYSDAAIVRNYN